MPCIYHPHKHCLFSRVVLFFPFLLPTNDVTKTTLEYQRNAIFVHRKRHWPIPILIIVSRRQNGCGRVCRIYGHGVPKALHIGHFTTSTLPWTPRETNG